MINEKFLCVSKQVSLLMAKFRLCIHLFIVFSVCRSGQRDPFCVVKIDNETVAR